MLVRNPEMRRLLRRILTIGLVLVACFVLWQSPLPLYLGLEPRRSITLSEIIRITGWHELRHARLIHGEDRPWHFHALLAEVEMPEADAMALLGEFQRLRETSHIAHGGPLDTFDIDRRPRWWKPTPISPEATLYFTPEQPSSSPEPIWYGLCVAERAHGKARVFLLWDQR